MAWPNSSSTSPNLANMWKKQINMNVYIQICPTIHMGFLFPGQESQKDLNPEHCFLACATQISCCDETVALKTFAVYRVAYGLYKGTLYCYIIGVVGVRTAFRADEQLQDVEEEVLLSPSYELSS